MTTFDLTLKGHPDSFADLNISSQQLANPGLWSSSREGFRPWLWPCLNEASEQLSTRVEAVAEHFDEPILKVLGLVDDNVFPHFTRSQLQFLTRDDPKKVTFAQFVDESDMTLRGKDEQHNETARHRIAAARVHKWLERMVLPRQDLLVDAPHLVSRFPSLVGDDRESIDAWQATAVVCGADRGASADLPVRDGQFDWKTWLSRPAWIWPLVQADDTIEEVRDPWGDRFSGFRFCEDVSAFAPEEQTRDFTADSTSTWSTRWVIDPDRLPGDHPWVAGPFGVRKSGRASSVRYQPLVQLSL